jgi:ribonuclease Y
MTWLFCVIALIIGLAAGAAAGYYVRQKSFEQEMGELESMRARLLEEAEKQARDIVLNGKDEALKIRQEVEGELEQRSQQLRREEDRIQNRREQLDNRQERIDRREQQLNKRQSSIDKRWNQLREMESQRKEELQKIANLSVEEARQILLEQVAEDTRQDMARVIREEELRAREEADRRARDIITTSIQRLASEQVADLTTTTLEIPSDELKGRIIGRGGGGR